MNTKRENWIFTAQSTVSFRVIGNYCFTLLDPLHLWYV